MPGEGGRMVAQVRPKDGSQGAGMPRDPQPDSTTPRVCSVRRIEILPDFVSRLCRRRRAGCRSTAHRWGGAAASSSLKSFESIWRSVRPEAAPAAGFAGSNPICPARQSGLCGLFARGHRRIGRN